VPTSDSPPLENVPDTEIVVTSARRR
jgi:hypothetical protein